MMAPVARDHLHLQYPLVQPVRIINHLMPVIYPMTVVTLATTKLLARISLWPAPIA